LQKLFSINHPTPTEIGGGDQIRFVKTDLVQVYFITLSYFYPKTTLYSEKSNLNYQLINIDEVQVKNLIRFQEAIINISVSLTGFLEY
jgi:hypothetical protein